MKFLRCLALLFCALFAADFAAAAESFFSGRSPRPLAVSVGRVTEIERRLIAGADPATLESSFRTAERQLKGLISSINRGYEDEAFAALGYLYDLWGQDAEALKFYRRSLNAKSNQPEVLFRAGRLLRLAGQNDQARTLLEEAAWRKTKFGAETATELALLPRPAQKPSPVPAVVVATSAPGAVDKAPKKTPNAFQMRTDAEQLIHGSDALAARAQLSNGTELAETVARQSECRDDKAVRLAIDGALKLRQVDRAAVMLRCGLGAKPKSPLLLESKRQLAIEYGLKP